MRQGTTPPPTLQDDGRVNFRSDYYQNIFYRLTTSGKCVEEAVGRGHLYFSKAVTLARNRALLFKATIPMPELPSTP